MSYKVSMGEQAGWVVAMVTCAVTMDLWIVMVTMAICVVTMDLQLLRTWSSPAGGKVTMVTITSCHLIL